MGLAARHPVRLLGLFFSGAASGNDVSASIPDGKVEKIKSSSDWNVSSSMRADLVLAKEEFFWRLLADCPGCIFVG